jgi:hypothetical protein
MKKRRLTKTIKGIVILLTKSNYNAGDIAHYLRLDVKKVKEFINNECE